MRSSLKFYRLKFKILFFTFVVLTHCASDTSIFPPVPTTTETAQVVLPDPISIAVDPANNQIIVVNSNVDFAYSQGSLMTIGVDATNPNSPVLSVTSVLATVNYGGGIVFDGSNAYIPFREGSDSDSNTDRIMRFAVRARSLSESRSGTTGDEPFGAALSGGNILVVSDRELNIFDTDLNGPTSVDLTRAQSKGIVDTESRFVENVAVDTVRNRAFITNRLGKVFVVDLGNNLFSYVIKGPDNSRGIAFDGTFIYIVDGNPPALWVFDPALLPNLSSPPEEVDDATILVDVISLGANPNGIAVDAANGRAYVANTDNRSVSVIDLNLFSEISRISLKTEDSNLTEAVEPFGIAVGTYNGVPFVFVANIGSDTISVINANTLKVVASFPR